MGTTPLPFQELEITPEILLWVAAPEVLATSPEKILRFESSGGRPLTLVSNYPYELWLDGVFVGDGGHRCTPGEALADHWEIAADAQSVQVRLHWLEASRTSVLYRCLFPDPFFAEIPSGRSWVCFLDHSVLFAAQASAQLPRQNILISKPEDSEEIELQPASLNRTWKIIPSPVKQARYQVIEPKLCNTQIFKAQTSGIFRPEAAENIALYVLEHGCVSPYEEKK
jgi:hypothetical protein